MYCLEDNEKMRDSFIKLLEIHLPSHDVSKVLYSKRTRIICFIQEKDGLLSQITMGDSLTHFIRAIRLKTERFVLSAARVIGMGMNEE